MKKLSLLLSSLMVSASLMADPIDAERAKSLAAQFMPSAGTQPELVKTAARRSSSGRRLAPAYQKVAPYYIFSRGENLGFVIVSGDDALPEVLGYTESGDYDETNMSPFLKWYLDYYGSMIEDAQETQLPRRAPQVTATARVDIAPMIATHWDQGWPYSNLCPDRKDGGGKCLTGCVATAAAQVLYYWHKDLTDVTLAATSSYTYGDQAKATRAFPKGTKLKWGLMRTKYGTEPEEYRTAVATLMAVVGGGAGLTYGSSTAGYPENCINVFKNIFGMNGGTHKYKDHGGATEVSDDAWATQLYNELMKQAPILYAGCREYKDNNGDTQAEGHAIVIDGYQAKTGYFHFNLGWGGQGDGYFTVARSKSPSWGFNDSWQEYVIGVSPRKQNMQAEFVVRPKVYFNRSNTFTIEVKNNGTLDYSGIYFFANTTGKKPTQLSEAKDKDTETVLSNKGTAVRLKLQAKPTNASKWYFYVTDKYLNVLAQYETMPETPVNDLLLTDVNLIGSSDTEVHNGETYTVIYNTRAMADVVIENKSKTNYEGTPRMAIYESTDDGKTFNYVGYKYGKIAIDPCATGSVSITISSTSNCPVSIGNLYYGVMLDTIPALHEDDLLKGTQEHIIRFVMKEGALDAVSYENGCVKLSGLWDINRFITITKKSSYKGATSFDLTDVSKIGEIPVLEANPNVVYYVSDDSQATGQNVIKGGVCSRLVLKPGYDFAPLADFKALNATISIDMPACRWGLLTVPCDVTVPDGIFARRVESHASSGISSRTVDVRDLEAGHTYLMMTSSNKSQMLYGVDAQVVKQVVANVDTAIVGTFVSTTTPAGAFLVNDEDQQYFALADEGTAVEALRGYFYASNVTKDFRAYSSIAADPSYQSLAERIQAAYTAIDEYGFYAKKDSTDALCARIDSAEIVFTERTASISDVRARFRELEALTQNYIAGAPNPYELLDYTSYIVNPSFESSKTGWETDGLVKKNSELALMSVGANGNNILYNCKADSTGTALTQVVQGLPRGYYRLTAKVGSSEGRSITMFAGDTAVVVKASPMGVHYLVEARIDDIFVTTGELPIGIREGDFYKVDDFQLTLTGYAPVTIPEDVNGDGSVDTQDVLKIYEYIQNATGQDAGDVNGDGSVDTQDVLKVYEYIQAN
ncbi:MAG: C10 family peptidase [Bacteroidaceae bacterium]|nr:C10 family peptidase [Bacteroidaceae bacterium]